MDKVPEQSPNPETQEQRELTIISDICEHIAQPCKDNAGNNLQDFYLREAQRYLKDDVIKTPNLREAPQAVIEAHNLYNMETFRKEIEQAIAQRGVLQEKNIIIAELNKEDADMWKALRGTPNREIIVPLFREYRKTTIGNNSREIFASMIANMISGLSE